MLLKQKYQIDIIANIPFILIHVGCLLIFWAGFSWTALITCFILWFVRMFGITAGYHRYFSHRTYKTSRWFQFILAVLGNSSAQLDPLWWAAHHRHHHRYADTQRDFILLRSMASGGRISAGLCVLSILKLTSRIFETLLDTQS